MVSSPPYLPTHPTWLPVPGPLCAQLGLRGYGEAGLAFS